MRILISGLGAVVALAALAVHATNAQPTGGPSGTTLAVRAVDGWQDAAIDLTVGEALEIRYITGTWTINTAGNWFDADGYPGFYPRDVQGACADAALPDAQNGALIGHIGNGPPFLIGNHLVTVADRSGALQMRMNDADACRHDNGGSVEVFVTNGPSATLPATAVPATAVPTTAVPTTAVPGTAVPATEAPVPAVPSQALPGAPTVDPGPTVRTAPFVPTTTYPSASPSPPPPAHLPKSGGSGMARPYLALVGLLVVLGVGARTLGRHRPSHHGT